MFRFPQEKVDIVNSDGTFCLASGRQRPLFTNYFSYMSCFLRE